MTKKKPAFIAAVLILIEITIVMCSIGAGALEPVVLDGTKDEYRVGINLEYLEDTTAKLTYKEVSSPKYDAQWKKPAIEDKFLGKIVPDSAYWIRIKVVNNTQEERFVFLPGGIVTEWIDFYTTDEKGSVIHNISGAAISFTTREIGNHTFAFNLALKKSDSRTVYVRAMASRYVIFHPVILTYAEYSSVMKNEYLFRGLFLGLVFLLFLFNFILFVFSRKNVFINLSLYILFVGLFRMAVIDLMHEYLWPELLHWNTIAYEVFCYLGLFFAGIYGKQYMRLHTVPKINKVMNGMLILLLVALVSPFINARTGEFILNFMATLSSTVLIIAMFVMAVKGDMNARWMAISFSPIIIGVFIQMGILYLGINFDPNMFLDLIFSFNFILLTISTANSFYRSMEEVRTSQEKIIAIQNQATGELERKVEERTKELAAALEEVGTINERLTESNAKLEGFGATLRRYLPMQLVDSIIRGEKVTGSNTERRKITVFFSDIKAFTDTTDSLEAEELSSLLNEYLTEMTAIAMRYGGTIDKFIGDAVMIFFGAPESKGDREDALQCLRMAVAMQERMKVLQEKWFRQGIERPLQIRIGINTGVATVGDFGAEERLSYTTIGGQVNLASRLESICEPGKILISHATWALVSDEFPCTPKGEVQVKGIHHDILVYEVGTG